MNPYETLTAKALKKGAISEEDVAWILRDEGVSLLPLLHAAYQVRVKYFGNKVRVHILNNVKSGSCQEDCSYCTQSGKSDSEIARYPMRKREEIIEEAKKAFERGAFRYCMVFSGNHLSDPEIENVCSITREIKEKYPIEICVSAGFLTEEKTRKLVDAGVNRYNHNLNTSRERYPEICSSHTYQRRLDTLLLAKSKGVSYCGVASI